MDKIDRSVDFVGVASEESYEKQQGFAVCYCINL